MIVFDASPIISAALRESSVPAQALLLAEETDLFALSDPVDAEIEAVLDRPRFATAAGADAIVSGDADLLVLHPWRGVRILRPAEYLAEMGRGT